MFLIFLDLDYSKISYTRTSSVLHIGSFSFFLLVLFFTNLACYFSKLVVIITFSMKATILLVFTGYHSLLSER